MKILISLIWLIVFVMAGSGLEKITQEPQIFASYGMIMGFIYTMLESRNLAV